MAGARFSSLCLLLRSLFDKHLKSPGSRRKLLPPSFGFGETQDEREGGEEKERGAKAHFTALRERTQAFPPPLSMPIPAIRLCLPSNETYSSSSRSLAALKLTLQHSQLNPQGPLCEEKDI